MAETTRVPADDANEIENVSVPRARVGAGDSFWLIAIGQVQRYLDELGGSIAELVGALVSLWPVPNAQAEARLLIALDNIAQSILAVFQLPMKVFTRWTLTWSIPPAWRQRVIRGDQAAMFVLVSIRDSMKSAEGVFSSVGTADRMSRWQQIRGRTRRWLERRELASPIERLLLRLAKLTLGRAVTFLIVWGEKVWQLCWGIAALWVMYELIDRLDKLPERFLKQTRPIRRIDLPARRLRVTPRRINYITRTKGQ